MEKKRVKSEMQNLVFQDEYIRLNLSPYVAEEESLSAPVKLQSNKGMEIQHLLCVSL